MRFQSLCCMCKFWFRYFSSLAVPIAGVLVAMLVMMPRKQSFLIWSLFFTLQLLTFANAEDNSNKVNQLELELKKLKLRVGNVELKNRDQDDEILSLKAHQRDVNSNTKQTKDMELRHNEAYYELNNKTADNYIEEGGGIGTMRHKRPFRLLPSQSQVDIEKQLPINDGPPSSCNDINTNGHTVNGIYLAKDLNNSKIKAIFCDFKSSAPSRSSSTATIAKEKILGYIDVKSSSVGVYFYVQSSGKLTAGNGVILFDKERLNIGGGMNLKWGVFKAPRAGTYAFLFSIVKNGYISYNMEISLRLNGSRIGHSLVNMGIWAMPATLQATLKLKKGDRIDLQKESGNIAECSSGSYCHHFTGWLLEEDLEL